MTEDEKTIVTTLADSVAKLAEQVANLQKQLEEERQSRARNEFGLRHEISGLMQLNNQLKAEHGVLVDRVRETQDSLSDYARLSVNTFKRIASILTKRKVR